MTSIPFRSPWTLVVLSVLLAACAGGASGTGLLQFDATAPKTVRLEALDISWSEDKLSANVGQPVTVSIENKGVLDHNFVIEELGIEVHLTPGESKEVSFVVDAAGSYHYLCTVPGHLDAGMIGTLTIGE